ncbi:enoyl-ACP reductase FabI [Acuticoccus sp. MNP-M23]|uniref:enoyl-ACP reductase FabI n=1 Tax=Acuticoccus sp. MNP-M23 TaxID=3072793 RepID=UPI0028169117|nr:enoyl-ACP reductase FabI [Acuticoccus sp. MNP-M23]WMS44913.1 enoyl-ACP reductase FabI [Acuticoccus sp. MNP-M23]
MGETMLKSSGLLAGKRGIVMGIANDHSIAWGIARQLHAEGAELGLTYQNDQFGKRVRPLAAQVNAAFLERCDVEDLATVDNLFDAAAKHWGSIDFFVHAVAFSDKNELKGRYADTTRENFSRTMVISCFSFTEAAKRAAALMPNGGAMLTLSYGGAVKVMPNYNVMGVAKSALESSVRYLAADFGAGGVRVNAISAGPVRTLAGAGVTDARLMFNYQRKHSPLERTVDIEEIGRASAYLLSDYSSGVTGEIHYVDSGYNVMSMPKLDELRAEERREIIEEKVEEVRPDMIPGKA